MKLKQRFNKTFLSTALCGAIAFLSATHAAEVSEVPVFAIGGVEPNIIMVLDDSGSMEFETVFPTNDGVLRFNNQGRAEANGQLLFNPPNNNSYSAIFPENRNGSNEETIPPINAYGYAFSSDFNGAYYNPAVTYNPWPVYGCYQHNTDNQISDNVCNSDESRRTSGRFPLSSPTSARISPTGNNDNIDLTSDITGASFDIQTGMFKNNAGEIKTNRDNNNINIQYYPAFYFHKVIGSEYTFTIGGGTFPCQADNLAHNFTLAPNKGELYYEAMRNPGVVLNNVDALAPDGSCLKKVEIRASTPTYTHTVTLDDGTLMNRTRTYAQEIQNFSNWFTYYRSRNMALRGGLGEGFQNHQNKNFRLGSFTINKRNAFDDMDTFSKSQTSFLKMAYSVPAGGSTPLRSALKQAGERYSQTGDDAIITHRCQANYTVLFTDGFNSERSVSGIENEDENAGMPFQDAASGTLADVAYKYYEDLHLTFANDPKLRGGGVKVPDGCKVESPPKWLDCNDKLHMTTYTFGLNARGMLYDPNNPQSNSTKAAHQNNISWPTTSINTQRNASQIDDLWHAAVNGRGEIVNAATTTEIKKGIDQILNSILTGEFSNSGVDSSDKKIAFNGIADNAARLVFQAKMNLETQGGDLEAFKFSLDPENPNIPIIDNSSPIWSAADLLEQRDPVSRKIYSFNASNEGTGIVFSYDKLSNEQKNDLKTVNGELTGDDTLATSRLAFLRGDRSLADGVILRSASTPILGDIASSTPIYYGAPSLRISDSAPFGAPGDRYSKFKLDNIDRQGVVYVGANDGMLHAFKVETGEELFAYVPGIITSTAKNKGMHFLTEPNYVRRSYVDLSPSIYDAYVKTPGDNQVKWRSILVGGLRTGGKGIFALDITNPNEYATAQTDDNGKKLAILEYQSDNIGTMLDKPQIALLNNEQWAIVFSNGYQQGSAEELEGQLFIVFLNNDNAASPKVMTLNTGVKGGLSGATLADMDRNGTVDRVYAGDLLGNMWAFDLKSNNANEWKVANDRPLFTAPDNQYITSAPSIAPNPYTASASGKANFLVGFGTGKYLAEPDITDDSQQSFYLIYDDSSNNTVSRSMLKQQTFVTNGDIRTANGNAPNWNTERGWYFDFPIKGERSFLQPKVFLPFSSISFFSSTPSEDACDSGGKSWFMTLGLDGQPLGKNPFANVPAFDVPGAVGTFIGDVIMVNHGAISANNSGSVSLVQVGRGSDGSNFTPEMRIQLSRNGKRQAWEELVNTQ